jgi:glycosyltransferase involved in cell wall biosynthesis
VKEAWRRGHLQKLIVVSKKRNSLEFDPGLIDTFPGESRLVSALSQIRGRIWKAFPSRWCGETVFDLYASSRLSRKSGDLIVTPGLLSTARKAKMLGYRTFLYAATPHPQFLEDQIRAERALFGFQDRHEDKFRSWMVARWSAGLRYTDYILAVSEFCKETYMANGFAPERISVVPLGVSLERFAHTPPATEGHFTCLFVGHVNGTTGIVKGLQYLLQAWCELRLQDATLQICGKLGPEASEIVRRFKGKLSTVQFMGAVRDPAPYYRRAAVFLLPSVAEGMARVTIEAMACGRPVVVTPNCGAAAREGVDGFYVPPRNVEALKEKILFFYTNRAEVARMGANAAEHARSFSWNRFSLGIADAVLALDSRVKVDAPNAEPVPASGQPAPEYVALASGTAPQRSQAG